MASTLAVSGILATVIGVLSHVVLGENKLRLLCENNPNTPIRIHILCEQLERQTKLDQGEVTDWYNFLGKNRFIKDATATNLRPNQSPPADYSAQDSSIPGMFFGVRVRRGGNYIRFGRSAESYPYALKYLSSFAGRDTRGDGHYVRFGRSADTPEINLKTDDETGAPEPFFKQFGVDKRFMRFGKRPDQSLENYNDFRKRFMRFGKRFDESEEEKRDDANIGDGGKQFMRWGKRLHPQKSDLENVMYGEWIDKRLDDGNENAKRFMRFGRGENDGDVFNENGAKRFMRFGKRDNRPFSLDDIDPNKRFMRFGKRDEGTEDEEIDSHHIIKRSVKATAPSDDRSDRQLIVSNGAAQTYPNDGLDELDTEQQLEELPNMVPDSPPEVPQVAPSAENTKPDVLSVDKKFMRFGKREGPVGGIQNMIDFRAAADAVKQLKHHFDQFYKRQDEIVPSTIDAKAM